MILGKIAIPIAIVLSATIAGGFFYAVQLKKQESTEKQQQIELREKKTQQDLDNKRSELKLKQDECVSLSSGVKQHWNNVVGVTYDDKIWNECVVTYTDTKTGEIQTSPLRFMQDTK